MIFPSIEAIALLSIVKWHLRMHIVVQLTQR